MLRKIFMMLTLLLFSTSLSTAEIYRIDTAHTQIHFSIAHLKVFKVRGNFNDFIGTVDIDALGETLKAAEAKIRVDSIDTGNQKREKHLLSDDFFAADKYPEIHFVTKQITGSGADITVVGVLTIRGISKEVTLNGEFLGTVMGPMGNSRAGFEATGIINRNDFGLGWNRAMETGGFIVGDEVTIGLEVEAIKVK